MTDDLTAQLTDEDLSAIPLWDLVCARHRALGVRNELFRGLPNLEPATVLGNVAYMTVAQLLTRLTAELEVRQAEVWPTG